MKNLLQICFLLVLTVFIVGCGWKPDVAPVSVTEPWSSMKLPVGNETSIVFTSDPKEFRAAHKGDAKVTSGYVDTLKAQGWEMAKFDTSKEDSALATGEFTKGIDRLTMRAYMFDGSTTAVVLELNPQP